jgi:hypothetical protein
MQKGPYIKLAIDLHEMDKFFHLDYNLEERLDYDLIIDRRRFDETGELLKELKITNRQTIQEFCFVILWIEKEIQVNDHPDSGFGKYKQMLEELADLNQYLMNHRITGISLSGEYEKDKPGQDLILKDPMNIDRICDGFRSIFSKEFHHKQDCKAKAGQIAWKKKKMAQVKNALLKYLDSIPKLESLSFETHFYIIGKLAALAGFYKSEEDYRASTEGKHPDLYRNYLIQSVKMLK